MVQLNCVTPMMMLAKISGCDYAKIQKRNPDVCVTGKTGCQNQNLHLGEI